jgi:hypothetical protein
MARYGYGQLREAAFSPQLVSGVLKAKSGRRIPKVANTTAIRSICMSLVHEMRETQLYGDVYKGNSKLLLR